jgi:hypothetical protein
MHSSDLGDLTVVDGRTIASRVLPARKASINFIDTTIMQAKIANNMKSWSE